MKKDEKLQMTKDKLVASAHKLMNELDDPAEVTSRTIAADAGVKPAMINYCFGSREALLFEAARIDEEKYKKELGFYEKFSSDEAPKEILRKMHYAVADYLINEYKFTKALTGYILLNRNLSQGLTSLPLIRAHFGGRKEEWELKLISYQLSSMTQLIIYRLEDMSEFLEIDIRKEIHKIIDTQIELLLGE